MNDIPTFQELEELAEGEEYRRPATVGQHEEAGPDDQAVRVEAVATITDVQEVTDDLGRPAGHVVRDVVEPDARLRAPEEVVR